MTLPGWRSTGLKRRGSYGPVVAKESGSELTTRLGPVNTKVSAACMFLIQGCFRKKQASEAAGTTHFAFSAMVFMRPGGHLIAQDPIAKADAWPADGGE
jgi:hypothetical protein